jgi:hypothetical protein
MKNLAIYFTLFISLSVFMACSKDENPVANDVTLRFDNTFKDKTIVLGNATSSEATTNTSAEGQIHQQYPLDQSGRDRNPLSYQ